jgi:tRNA nucleotidyltransferase/poly(A) polymerase
VRLGFTVEERTQMQVANAREAGVERTIPARALAEELRRIGAEDNPADILRALGEAGLLTLFSPALGGPKINLPGITKFERLSRMLPDDARSRTARIGPFLWVLTERLTPKEKQVLIATTEMPKAQVDQWQKLEARAKKLETALRSARIRKASQVYHLVSPAAPDEVLFLMYHSPLKPVQERLRNYYQKYLPAIQEITAEEWAALEGKPGTPRQNKAREEFIANRLDRRPPRPPAEPETPGPEGAPGPVGAPGPAAPPVEPGVVRRTR